MATPRSCFYRLVVAAGKYRTLKHDGRFCACRRQDGRRGEERGGKKEEQQTGRSPGRALAALENMAHTPPSSPSPALWFNALESSAANTSCHAKLAARRPLLLLAWRRPIVGERGRPSAHTGPDGAAADATLGDIASVRRTATGTLSPQNISVSRFLDLKKLCSGRISSCFVRWNAPQNWSR